MDQGASGDGVDVASADLERMELENGVSFDVTLCDVANLCAILTAEALGISRNQTPDELTANAELKAAVDEIQSKAGELFGIWPD